MKALACGVPVGLSPGHYLEAFSVDSKHEYLTHIRHLRTDSDGGVVKTELLTQAMLAVTKGWGAPGHILYRIA